LKKISPVNQPLNSDHEFYILVRGLPNERKKIIWEQLVDVKKLFACLQLLKKINPLYRDINLPKTVRL